MADHDLVVEADCLVQASLEAHRRRMLGSRFMTHSENRQAL